MLKGKIFHKIKFLLATTKNLRDRIIYKPK